MSFHTWCTALYWILYRNACTHYIIGVYILYWANYMFTLHLHVNAIVSPCVVACVLVWILFVCLFDFVLCVCVHNVMFKSRWKWLNGFCPFTLLSTVYNRRLSLRHLAQPETNATTPRFTSQSNGRNKMTNAMAETIYFKIFKVTQICTILWIWMCAPFSM
jgi:hypothetical protein